MSTQQPQPGPGEEPRPDAGPSATSSGGGATPSGPSGGGETPPSGGLPKAPPPPGGPYGTGPAGGAYGAADPLAGMPPLAPLGRRLLARIVDTLVVGIPVTILLWPVAGDYDWNQGGGSYGQQAVVLLVYFVYEALMLSARGQTVGKMLLRVRVAMLDDGAVPRGNPAWIRAAVYSLPQLLPCIGFFFWLLNVLTCTWDRPYRQCLHDKAAKTVVVSTA
jgi:uncharacterized RDD family membrane protein YckC